MRKPNCGELDRMKEAQHSRRGENCICKGEKKNKGTFRIAAKTARRKKKVTREKKTNQGKA